MKKYLTLFAVLFVWGCIVHAQNFVIYGTTYSGGSSTDGVMYRFNPQTGKDSTLINFNYVNGGNPEYDCGMTLGSDGRLYGVTSFGLNAGVIYRYDPVTGQDTTVCAQFGSGNNGDDPEAMILASNGLFYGLCYNNMAGNAGGMFSYNPLTFVLTPIVPFYLNNGQWPNNQLVQAKDGYIYGITSNGGSSNDGVFFRFDIAASKDTVLFNFNGTNGANPGAGLIQAPDSLLYGVTGKGGTYNDGIIFSYNPYTFKDSVRYSFDNTHGQGAIGNLLLATNGLLYGMTYYGGTNNKGVLYSFNIHTNAVTVLVNFSAATGESPNSSLVQGPDGIIYGVTAGGGAHGNGAIFRFNPVTNKDSVLFSFNDTDGNSPEGNITIFNTTVTTGMPSVNATSCWNIYPNPNNGSFTISTGHSIRQDESQTIEIYNMLGEKIYSFNFSGEAVQMAIPNSITGIYLYRVFNADGKQLNIGKFIVE